MRAFGGGSASIINYGTGDLQVGTNGSERMRIDSSGNLLVGKSASSITANGFEVFPSGTVFSIMGGTANTYHAYDTTNNRYSFYVDVAAGRIYALQTSIAGISDERLKDIYGPMDNTLDKVMQLNPITFKYKKGSGSTEYGFSAQEVQPLFPEIIGKSKISDDDDTEYLNMSEGRLIPVLVKAIQEQQAMLVDQQALIEQLTARIEQLETN